ncbi:hypothetical protein OAT88_00810, partial [Gammaproteobacteria bacterium]|nr:hypothetical protein [Gammaproteobacteria bacterium]
MVSLTPSDLQVSSITERSLSVDTWIHIFHQLNLNGVAQRVFANVEYRRNQDGIEIFCLDRSQSAIYNEDLFVKFEAALREFFGYKMNVQVFVSDVESETPAGYKRRLADEAN